MEDKRNDRYRGQGPKKLHGKAKVPTIAQSCAWARCKVQIYKQNTSDCIEIALQALKVHLVGHGGTKKNANSHMRQIVRGLNYANMESAKYDGWWDLFLVRWVQPAQKYWVLRGTMFETRAGVCYNTTDEIMLKVTVWCVNFFAMVVQSLRHGQRLNRRVWLLQTVPAYAQGVHRCELSGCKSQFCPDLAPAQHKKALSNRAGKENICSGKGYHTKIATTQIRQMELFCALLIPRFYISDWNKNW